MSTLGLQYLTSDTVQTTSLGLSSQFPIGERWRLQPRLRVDRRKFETDGSSQTVYLPTLRTEWRWKKFTAEFEGGAEFGSRDLGQTQQDTTRYYLSLGYRYDF